MRLTRALAATAAAAVTVAVPLAVVSSPADAAATKHHTVTLNGKELPHNKFKMAGQVSPMYHEKKVQVLRQDSCKGQFKLDHVIKTSASGIFTSRIFIGAHQSQTCWFVKVPAGSGYAVSFPPKSDILRVYKI